MQSEDDRKGCLEISDFSKAGDPEFLELLAQFLSSGYGQRVETTNLITTNGASGGMLVLLKMLFPKTKPIVFVEEATYWIGLQVLREMGATIVPVKLTGNDGLDPTDLKAQINRSLLHSGVAGLRGLLYLIPHHQDHICLGTENRWRCS